MPKSTLAFPGFQSPNYTQVPDELLDYLMPLLSEAELKVLLYVVRRTFGFRKRADAISVNQMASGITTRDGRVLDGGTGLSKTSVRKAVQSLVEAGVLTVEKRQSEDGEYETNIYTLAMASGVGQILTHPDPESDPRVGQDLTPQQRVQQTDKQDRDFEFRRAFAGTRFEQRSRGLSTD